MNGCWIAGKQNCLPGARLRRMSAALLVLIWVMMGCALFFTQSVAALSAKTDPAPYVTYTYNAKNQPVQTAESYRPQKVLTAADLTINGVTCTAPVDLAVRDDRIYLLSSAGDVFVLDDQLTVKAVIAVTDAGKKISWQSPSGLYVCTDGHLLICDRKAAVVYETDAAGKLLRRFDAPSGGLVPDGFFFEPVRVLRDSGGITYVLSASSTSGALQYEKDGSFLGFYGAERVTLTPQVLMNYFWKKVLTDEQAAGLERTVPVEFISFDVDEKDFIYTIRQGNDVTENQVRKLNALGSNVLPDGVFGDRDAASPQLCDITVDDDGFITILDAATGKLFQYDDQSRLMAAFGGLGDRAGLFDTPCALASLDAKLLVADAARGEITVFEPTQFALHLRRGLVLSRTGRYIDAKKDWQAVLGQDFSNELAGVGLGKAAEQQNDLHSAMQYYRLGMRRDLYSQAFETVRGNAIRSWFAWLAVLVVLLLVGLIVWMNRLSKTHKVYGGGRSPYVYPFYCLIHPKNGFEDLKNEKSGRMLPALLILTGFFAVSVLNRQATGFLFNTNDLNAFRLLVTLASSVGLFVVFVVANWAMTTVCDGKGSFSEIFIASAYALLPYLVGSLIMVVSSQVLTLSEASFYHIGMALTLIWTCFQLLTALCQTHMYSVSKTVWTTLLTLFCMVVLVVIAAILYTVFTQLFGFVGSVFGELFLG